MFLKEIFEKYKWKAFIFPYIFLRIPALCLFVLDNDEFVPFRMISNFKKYFFYDVRLPFYDYLFTKIYDVIFGYKFFPLRIINLLIGMFTLYYVFNFFYDVLGKKAATIACLIYTISPIFVFYNVYTESYNLSIFCIMACVSYTNKILNDGITSREKNFFILLNLVPVYTHYLNIAFMGIYYFITTIRHRKFIGFFLIFLLLSLFPLGLRMYNSFFLHSGYGSSELHGLNLRVLSIYPYNNAFSVFFYTFTGIKSPISTSLFVFILGVLSFSFIFYRKNKFSELMTPLIAAYLYYFLLGIISGSLDREMFARSFSTDYLSITAMFMIFPVIWVITKKWRYSIFPMILILMISNVFIYKESVIINRQYLDFKKFVEINDPTFIVSDHITSEGKTKEAIRLFFPESDVVNTNKNKLSSYGYYVINLRIPKEKLNTLDKKTLISNNKRLEERYLQLKDVKEAVSNMRFVEQFKVGENIFVVYEKI